MELGIIGAGISGIFLALMLKKNNIENKVTLIDVNDKIGKKFLVTGNGRCNLGNKTINNDSYNSLITKKIVNSFPMEDQIAFYNSIGVELNEINDLYYPFSFSAKTLLEYFIKYLKERKIKVCCDLDVNEYSLMNNGKIMVRTSKRDFMFDKVIFATGGLSSIPYSSKRNNMFSLMKKHGYKVSDLKPGLTPIVVNEQVKQLENLRVKGNVKLFNGNKIKYSEIGEVLFKKDGLSGICIFNISSLITRNNYNDASVAIDLMPNISETELVDKLHIYNEINKTTSCLEGIFDEKLAEYIWKVSGVNNLRKFTKLEIKKLAKTIKNLKFTFKNSYDFTYSQVTIGGIEYENLNENLESKLEKNIYFIGEILNSDGLCGGYNIMFSFASAYKVYESFVKENLLS